MAWQEIGDRIFTRRYPFLDQEIGVILGGSDVLVVDTRSTAAHACEIATELRELTRDPISIVVDSHWHWDHTFGNHTLRPATIWGHVRAAARLRAGGAAARERVAAAIPEIAADIRETVIDPPENTFEDRATVVVGDRVVELSYHGRGHTDGDIAVHVPDAKVLFAGDLLEGGAAPSFSDSFPLDWPGTLEGLLPLADGPVVPGHGAVADRRFLEGQLVGFRRLAALARDVHAGRLDIEGAMSERLFEDATPEDAFERALAQLSGELV